MKTTRIVLTGGGSGGHVYPLLAVAEEIESLAIDQNLLIELYYCGPNDEFAQIMKKNGIRIIPILKSKIRRYFSLKNLIDIPKFFLSIPQAFFKLYIIMPDVIFSKGGPGALPIVMAGWFYRIPIIIHESDSVPGIANLFSSRMATRIAVAFEQTLKYFKMEKTAYIGNPIRPKLLAGTPEQKKAKNQLGFADSEPLIFITGGSQGAQRINDFIVASLPLILPIAQVYHQTGNRNIKNVEESTSSVLKTIPEEIKKHHSYKAVGYVERDELQLAYAAADIVISRAGSGSIYEIAGFKKPSILIPLLESANDHQRLNAYDFMKAGACIVIEESNLLPTIFVKELSRLLKNPEQLKAMGEAAWKFFKPEAANMLAQELLRLAR